jgi:hypothetical protein
MNIEPDSCSRAFVFAARKSARQETQLQRSDMRDKQDKATLDLVGFDADLPPASPCSAPAPAKRAARRRGGAIGQHQLELLDETDASGLPAWRRDEGLDLTGLPVWPASCQS